MDNRSSESLVTGAFSHVSGMPCFVGGSYFLGCRNRGRVSVTGNITLWSPLKQSDRAKPAGFPSSYKSVINKHAKKEKGSVEVLEARKGPLKIAIRVPEPETGPRKDGGRRWKTQQTATPRSSRLALIGPHIGTRSHRAPAERKGPSGGSGSLLTRTFSTRRHAGQSTSTSRSQFFPKPGKLWF